MLFGHHLIRDVIRAEAAGRQRGDQSSFSMTIVALNSTTA
jgi:hypothetical protein